MVAVGVAVAVGVVVVVVAVVVVVVTLAVVVGVAFGVVVAVVVAVGVAFGVVVAVVVVDSLEGDMNGYPESLVRIDAEMGKLGRPVPPVVSWLSRGLRGRSPNDAHAKWRSEIEAWEESNPEAAVQWLELRAQYAAEEERLEQLKHGTDAWNYVLLARLGCPQENIDVIRSAFRDTQSMSAGQRWLRDGTVWSLVLVGGHGCGKSSAAAWVTHQLLMRSYRPAWVDCAKQWQAPMYGVEAEHRRFTCRHAGVLVLDDLASKRQVERNNGPWLAWLDDVLGSRANERRKTIVTTNRSPDELAAWIGERLLDRLRAGEVHSSDEPSMRGGSR